MAGEQVQQAEDFSRLRVVEVMNTTRSCLLGARVSVADTSASRMKGLLGHTGLAPGEGLVIDPCNSIHTFFMKFTIDVLFVGRDDRVVRVLHAVPPWRLTWIYFRANRVVELPAGTLKASGTRAGDVLSFRPAAA